MLERVGGPHAVPHNREGLLRHAMKTYTFLFLICASLPALASAAAAQNAPPISADALVYARDGVVNGCGVRLTGGAPNASGPSTWFDVSVNVFRRDIAIAQAIAYEIRRSDFTGDSRPARVPLQSAWLRSADGKARLGENAERLDTLAYTLLTEDALALFDAIARGQPLSVGLKRWGDRVDSVYSGTPALADQTREQIGECLATLLQ
jgi:hypothetical protein